jgi:hypothetical protein
MTQILQWLDGKKTVILAIVGAIIGYLVAAGTISGQLGTLILAILNILGGGAVVATNAVLGNRNYQGIREKTI